jgi:microcystin-dependent protein
MGFLSTQATTTNIQTVSPGILVPSGVTFPYAGSVAPSGYLLCDGSAISRTTYSNLFAAISTSYGNGDGINTFNLPDFRYAFLRGAGSNISVTGTGTAGSNQATFTNHGIIRTGLRVRLSSGTLSTLATSTDYFAIVVDANTLAFASTYGNAMLGTRITLSGVNSAIIVQWEDPDLSTRLQAAVGGNTSGLGTRQTDEFKSHNHTVNNGPFTFWGFPGTGIQANSGQEASSRTPTLANNGGNQTNPRNIYVNYIIKT